MYSPSNKLSKYELFEICRRVVLSGPGSEPLFAKTNTNVNLTLLAEDYDLLIRETFTRAGTALSANDIEAAENFIGQGLRLIYQNEGATKVFEALMK